MTELIEYIVIVHKIEDSESLHQEIINSGGSECVPDRAIECNLNPISSRSTHYMMTEAEAELLIKDPRVWDISRTMGDLGIEAVPAGSYTQTTNAWSRGATTAQGNINWGILRAIEGVQRFQWGSDSPQQLFDVSASVTVPYNGTNVDVVIVDGHADPAHPEYAVNPDGSGGSRYNQFNWLSLSNGLYGTNNGNYIYTPYRQSQGASSALETNNMHGSHVAGIACGNTQGWARGANIYNIYPYGNDSNPFSLTNGTTQFINQYFLEYVRYWHQNKAVNPATGTRNPTIINNSWVTQRVLDISGITSVYYRGTTYTAPSGGFSVATLNGFGFPTYSNTQVRILIRYAPLESQIQDCINAGIIVVSAAGNYSTKIARDDQSTTDPDYNNTVSHSGGTDYYNRGTFTTISNGIVVGALSSSYIDVKSGYSETGPRIDVWAPGSYITSSVFNNTTYGGAVADARNSSYYQVKISGTSMACPQVTGLLATLLELFPTASQAAAQQYLIDNSKQGQLQDGGYNVVNPLYDVSLLQGAPNRTLYAYWPPAPTATVALPSVTIKAQTVAKFTPVIGSGGFGSLVYTISPALPLSSLDGTATCWIEAIAGRTDVAYFHLVSLQDVSNYKAGDGVFGAGIAEGSILTYPTDATKRTWVITPGRASNLGSAGSPVYFDTGLHINAYTGEIIGRTSRTQGSTTYTVTVTGSGISVSRQFSLAISSPVSYNITLDVPYGSDAIQKCDILQVENVTPKGVIVWVHGGGWSGGTKSGAGFTSNQAGSFINEDDQIRQLAQKGYIVVNCNYRLATSDSNYIPSPGGTVANYHPVGADDIETIIRFCTITNAGSGYSALWNTISARTATYGLIITGASAGGHLVAYAGMKYIYDYGQGSLTAICPVVGPMDLDYVTLNNATITPTAEFIVNSYVNSTGNSTALQSASPRYKYGSQASPGLWRNAVKNSNVKFIFVNNINDTLVPPVLTDNFINTLLAELGNNRVKYIQLDEGGDWAAANITYPSHNLTSQLSNIAETVALLGYALTTTIAVPTKQATAGTSVGSFTPVSFAGGSGTVTYSINPSLPSGLNFNTANGAITGTPIGALQTTTYTVTGTDTALNTVSGTFTLSIQSAPVSGSTNAVNHNDWNLLQGKVTAVLRTPNDSTVDLGWNQSYTSVEVNTNDKITGIEYDQIAQDVDKCYQQIANTRYQPTSRVPVTQKYLVTQSDYNGLSAAVDYCYTNRTTVSSSRLTQSLWTAHGGNISFTQAHGFRYQVDFPSNASFRSFWNAGGYITWNFSFVPAVQNPISQGWSNLLGSMGSFRLTRNSFTQSGQGGAYPATIGQTGGVYGGNMLINPDPINQVIVPTARVYEADANYTSSYFAMWLGVDNANLFQATSIIVVAAIQNNYVGLGGASNVSSGNPGLGQTVTYPFNIQPTGQTHVYNYIDGTVYYAPSYPGLQPSF
jgi:hypothetical protein